MFLVRCIPIIGTGVTAIEAVGALIDGDGKKFASKLTQTAVGGIMDTVFVMSGGASSLITAPLKEGVKIAGKKAADEIIAHQAMNIGLNVCMRATTQMATETPRMSGGGYYYRSGGGFGDDSSGTSSTAGGSGGSEPPRDPKLPKEHEMDDEDYDYSLDPPAERDHPITRIELGANGRVEGLRAIIQKKHLRPRGGRRRNISARVRRFVNSLGQVKDSRNSGTRESDEVGHIIADSLGGPHDRTYNFFPQSPFCNMEYYHKMEREIHDYLQSRGDDAFVDLYVELVYVDYHIEGVSPNRPRSIKVIIDYSNGKHVEFVLSNM